MNILVFSLQGLGNCILNFPFIKSLEKEYHTIDLVVPQNGAHLFYNKSPFINKLISMSKSYKEIRKTKYDLALATFPNLKRENLFLFLSKAIQKLSYTMDNEYFRFLYFLNNSKFKPDKSAHDLENTCNLLGIKPDLDIQFKDIYDANISINFKEPFVAIHFTSSTASKRISIEEAAKTINSILADNNLEIKYVYLLGTEAERHINLSIKELVKKSFKNNVLVPNDLTIIETTKIISCCQYFIGLDSALAHIAALFKKQSIIIWSFAKLSRIYPYNPNAHILMNSEINQIYIFKGDYPDNNLLRLQMNQYKADQILNILSKSAEPSGYLNSQNNFRTPYYEI